LFVSLVAHASLMLMCSSTGAGLVIFSFALSFPAASPTLSTLKTIVGSVGAES